MSYHKLLERQLSRYLVSPLLTEEYQKLFQAVSDAYVHFDEDHVLIERSLELSSKELTANNNKLRKASQELLKAQQMAHIGNWEWDIPGNTITWSDELYRMFGKTPQNYPSTYELYVEMMHPDDREMAQKAIQKALEDKKPFQFEHRVELSDRAIAYILQLGEVECDTGGAPIRIHGAAQDITDRKKAEERLKTTLDSMPQGCQLIDFHYRYLYVNDAVAKQGKTTKEELVGATMMEKYPGIENTDMFSHLRDCMEKRIRRTMDNEFTFPDESRGWFYLRIEPVPEGAFIFSEDITEIRKAEQESRARARELERMNAVMVGRELRMIELKKEIAALQKKLEQF